MVWDDGCATQFRSKFVFILLSGHCTSVILQKDIRWESTQRIGLNTLFNSHFMRHILTCKIVSIRIRNSFKLIINQIWLLRKMIFS